MPVGDLITVSFYRLVVVIVVHIVVIFIGIGASGGRDSTRRLMMGRLGEMRMIMD